MTVEEEAVVADTERWGELMRSLRDPALNARTRATTEAEITDIENRQPFLRRPRPKPEEGLGALHASNVVPNDKPADGDLVAAESLAAVEESHNEHCGSIALPEPTPEAADLFRHERQVFTSPQYYALSARARELLLHARLQFVGVNNGRLVLTLSQLSVLRFDARSLRAALRELIDAGFLVRTREQCRRRPALYGLSWRSLPDEKAPRGAWAKLPPKVRARKCTRKAGVHPELAEAA